MNNEHYLAIRTAFDTPWPGPQGKCIILRNKNISVTIYPEDGCRIASFNVYGNELLRQWDSSKKAFQYGCFPMIPWVGRLKEGKVNFQNKCYQLPVNKPPHALHGMACFSPWEILSTNPKQASFRFQLTAPWPWAGEVIYDIQLEENGLKLTLTIKTDQEMFPAAAGWHPWFKKTLHSGQPELFIETTPDWQEEQGNDELPTGNRIQPLPNPWDDCFGFNGQMQANLIWPEQLTLNIRSPQHYMVLFDKQPDATCVNPLSSLPNGVNTQPECVDKTHPLITTTHWTATHT